MDNKLNLHFVKIVQTCFACPSQWDAWTEDGTEYYIRYRWGHLSVSRGGPSGPDVFEWSSTDGMDGLMSTDDMLKRIGCTASEIVDES